MNIGINQKFNSTFRALKHRNYRLFFYGQCVSLIGTWIQQVAMSWLIYSLTKSPLIMGIMVFAGSLPSLVASPFAGVIIDRVHKLKALILTQSLFMIEALVLAVLTLTGVIQIWQIVVLSVLMGLTNAMDIPLRQAIVVKLVDDPKDLSNAISLNSSSFNLARLIGPAVAGVLIAAVGEGTCFLINAISYIAVIFALLLMKMDLQPIKNKGKLNVFAEFKEGYQYVCSSIQLKSIILYLAISSLIGMSFPVIMPVYAKEILHGGADTLGFLMSASGIGALIGALYLAGRKSVEGLENWVCIATLFLGLGLIGMSLTSGMISALALMFLTGMGMVIIIAACNTLIQHFVDDDKRGRVMSLYTMAFMGTVPIGSLLGGAIAQKLGVADTFLLFGLSMILTAAFFSTKRKHFFPAIEQTAEQELTLSNEGSGILPEAPVSFN